jgi:hypothetical protein
VITVVPVRATGQSRGSSCVTVLETGLYWRHFRAVDTLLGVQTRVFPDTEPFVDSGCYLFAGQQGTYVIDRQNIYLLSIA